MEKGKKRILVKRNEQIKWMKGIKGKTIEKGERKKCRKRGNRVKKQWHAREAQEMTRL